MTARREYPELQRAVQSLAGVCDGAVSDDNRGFNGMDARFGNSLAGQSEWTQGQAVAAYKMLRKYRNTQLPSFGIDYDSIVDPAQLDPDDLPKPAGRVELVDDGHVALSFPYDAELVKRVRGMKNRKWDATARRWVVAVTFGNAHDIAELARDNAWDIDDDAYDALSAAIEGGPADAELPQPNVQVDRNEDGEPVGFIISFDYDRARVAAVKSNVTGRRWDGKRKLWKAPLSELAARELVSVCQETGMTFDAEAEAVARELVEKADALQLASRLEDADVHVEGLGDGLELMPFQRAGVAYAASVRRCIVGDDPGLGKTMQALGAIQHTGSYPALVVVPASVKLNWVRKTEEWLPGRSVDYLDAKGEPMGTQPDILVVNYDLLMNVREPLSDDDGNPVLDDKGKPKKSKPKPSPALQSLLDADWQALILDEVHYVKNPKAQRTKAVEKLANKVPADGLVLGLSGTPMKNRPAELITPLRILGHFDSMFGSWVAYVRRYCAGFKHDFGWDISGASNLEELNERLRGTCMIRRLKKDVQKELPDKARYRVTIPLSNAAEYRRAEADVISYFSDKKAEDAAFLESIAELSKQDQREAKEQRRAETKASASQAEALVRINTLRQLVGQLKTDACVDWVRDFLDGSEGKLVIFAHHIAVQNRLKAEFEDVCVALQGGATTQQRQEVVDRFVGDDDVRLFVGSIGAAGTGIDALQRVASNVAFLEFAWTPGDMQQAEDRVHRIGQDSDSVTVWHLVADDTIDDYMQEQLAAKQAVLDAALGAGDEAAAAKARSANVMRAVIGSLMDKGA